MMQVKKTKKECERERESELNICQGSESSDLGKVALGRAGGRSGRQAAGVSERAGVGPAGANVSASANQRRRADEM